jgi:hypothetical protein
MQAMLNNRPVDDIEVDGVDPMDYPDFSDAYISSAVWLDTGLPLSDSELEQLTELNSELIYDQAVEWSLCRSDFYSFDD